MKNVNELALKILELQKLGADEGKIKELLDLKHSVAEILAKYEEEKAFITVEEIAARFESEYGKADNDNYYYLRVLRLLKSGDIKGTKQSNVKGWKVLRTDVEKYIEESKMSKEDWKNYAKELEKKLAALQAPSETREGAENNEEKTEALTVGEEQKNAKMPPSHALVEELNELFARLQSENEVMAEVSDDVIQKVKEQIIKDGGFQVSPNGRFKNPLNKRHLLDTKEEVIIRACTRGSR